MSRPGNIAAFEPDQQRVIEDIYNTLGNVSIRSSNGGVIYLVGSGGGSSGALSYLNRQIEELNNRSLPELKEDLSTLDSDLEALDAELDGKFPVQTTDIADDAVTTPKLIANAVTTAKIAADAVTANEIAAGTITANEIAAGTITANEIATGTITANEINVADLFAEDIALTGSISNSNGDYSIDATGIKLVNNSGSKNSASTLTFIDGANTNLEVYSVQSGLSIIHSRGDISVQRNGNVMFSVREEYIDFVVPFEIPTHTDTSRAGLSPEQGMMIFNASASHNIQVWDGSSWRGLQYV